MSYLDADEPQRNWRLRTRMVRGGLERTEYGETSEALFLNSGFVYASAEAAEARFAGDEEGYVYSRYGNPTVGMLERRLALMEGAEAAFATSSGMAAVFAALMCQVQVGDHVVASRALFGSCYYIIDELLPRYGVTATMVDGPDLAQWEAAITEKTRAVFFETPANPTLELIDIAAVSRLAHAVGASVIVDNVFSTPLLQRPLELGADVVTYSGTKHIDGQGRCLGGVVLSNQEFIQETLLPFVRHTGPALSPFNAWVMLKGLETLPARVAQHCESAQFLADRLSNQAAVTALRYPWHPSHPQYDLARRQMQGGSSVLSFELKGGKDAAFKLVNALEIIDISNNLGDAKSLICHPATTTHRSVGEEGRAAMGISDGLVRLSVGLEDPEDLAADLEAGFKAAA